MPRTSTQSPLDRMLDQIVSRAVQDIADAVRQNIAEEVTRVVGGGRIGRAGSAGALGRIGRKRRVILCPVAGCGKPGGGPKWGWFCANHKDLSEAEKDKARAETRARPGAGKRAAAKRATRKRGRKS